MMTVATREAYDTLAPGAPEWRPWESPAPGPWWQLEGVDATEALLISHADVGDPKPPYLVEFFTGDKYGGPAANDLLGAGLEWERAYLDQM